MGSGEKHSSPLVTLYVPADAPLQAPCPYTQPLAELGAVSVYGSGKEALRAVRVHPTPAPGRGLSTHLLTVRVITQQGDVCKYPNIVVLDLGAGRARYVMVCLESSRKL